MSEYLSPDWILEEGNKAMLAARRAGAEQADVLMAAGWRFVLPEIENGHGLSTEPWQWYWRSPPKRANSKGRKYWSTNQAFMALRRLSGR